MREPVYQRVLLVLIDEPSHRLRESIDAEKLGELADSMASEGLHQPVGVRGPSDAGRFEVVWGHRRVLAAQLLRWDSIPARVFPPDFDPLLAAVTENLQRADLTPVEEAQAVARFVERGEPIVAVARLFRRSVAWVHARLELLHFPADLVAAVQAGALSLGVARALRDVDHAPYRASLVDEAARVGATVATVEVWRAHYLADRDRIVRNIYTVEEIVGRREAWVIFAECESCRAKVDYRETRSYRFCRTCSDEVDAAIAGAASPLHEGPGNGGGRPAPRT